MAQRLDCGHAPTLQHPGSITNGIARDSEGKTMCYTCAYKAQLKILDTDDVIVGYLSADGRKVTVWTGETLMTVTRAWDSRAARKTYVQAIDHNGTHWYGVGPLESGTYVTMRRRKGK